MCVILAENLIKMTKCLIKLIFVFNITNMVAQVGIGTTAPQQQLHVAGVNSTIRVDGLDQNNANNNGIDDAVVYVNANGDLVLNERSPTFGVNLLGASLISTGITLTSTGPFVSATLASGNFNLTKNGMVHVLYEIGVSNLFDNVTGLRITDGAPRVYSVFLRIDGVQVSRASSMYTNIETTLNVANGYFTLDGSVYKDLAAGNHTYEVIVGAFGHGAGFNVTFGGINNIDRFQIVKF